MAYLPFQDCIVQSRLQDYRPKANLFASLELKNRGGGSLVKYEKSPCMKQALTVMQWHDTKLHACHQCCPAAVAEYQTLFSSIVFTLCQSLCYYSLYSIDKKIIF
jgi:hypothetical protein